MEIEYTLETATLALNEFRKSKGNEDVYVVVKIVNSKPTKKPFAAASSEYYVGYHTTPLDCYNAVMIKRSEKIKHKKMYEVRANVVAIKTNPEPLFYNDDDLRNKAGKAIERGFYEEAMKYALILNDKKLISFINRLKIKVS